MDINALMNKEPPASGDQNQRASSLHRAPSVARSVSDNYAAPSQQQQFQRPSMSGYPAQPPPLDTRTSTFSNPGSVNTQYTSVRTPQAQHQQQYPFPAQYQSPVQAHHRGVEKFPSLTPTGRSASHSYGPAPHNQRSPSLFAAPPPPQSATHSHASATPPSANLHSPYGARGSPGGTHPLQHNPYGAAPHQSQPNTPLGPPLAQRPQVTTPREIVSPYAPHQRTYSGTSASAPKSVASNSPGPGVSSINNILDSPAGFAPPINHIKRRSTEHLPQPERDRTASISPKTQISRRNPSTDSRQNSQDLWSARSSLNQGRPDVDPRAAAFDQAPPGYAHPPSTLSRSSTGHFSQGAPSPLSQAHYLPQQRQVSNDLSRPSITEFHQPLPPKRPSEEVPHRYPSHEPKVSLLQQPVSQSMMTGAPAIKEEPVQATTPLKRRAEDIPQPEPKKPRTQYKEPPAWARLHPSNPGYEDQIRKYPQLKDMPIPDPRTMAKRPPPVNALPRAPPAALAQAQQAPAQANGTSSAAPPGDFSSRKADSSRKLGMPWELSITDMEKQNPIVKAVGYFLYWQFANHPQLMGGDPRSGGLEIEAKIGKLLSRDGNDLSPLELPIQTPTVLNQNFSRDRIRFESVMNEVDTGPLLSPVLTENANHDQQAQNKSCNDWLNNLLKTSLGLMDMPGVSNRNRVPLVYQHRYEKDTFAPLSEYGLSQLSDFARDALLKSRRDSPRLRTTYEGNNPKMPSDKPKAILAQIVKVRLDDLDIYCPGEPFDIRISVNIEVDFAKIPGVDLTRLIDIAAENDIEIGKRRADPDRYKDRISYRHLLYQIDLTQVLTDIPGAPERKHELEVEVDGQALGHHVELLKQKKENGFQEIVEGLVNNILELAQHKPEPPAALAARP
ncbi:mRNA capping enzyme beta chain-like protein [Elsinoe fawcettii]|nr:mRNA capping enzyme beta chain-like protein [Elsinoe fawcettii]